LRTDGSGEIFDLAGGGKESGFGFVGKVSAIFGGIEFYQRFPVDVGEKGFEVVVGIVFVGIGGFSFFTAG